MMNKPRITCERNQTKNAVMQATQSGGPEDDYDYFLAEIPIVK